jgi:hypothetical protein
MATATLTQVHKFFQGDDKDYNLAKFRAHWSELSDTDKTQLRDGIGDATLTY